MKLKPLLWLLAAVLLTVACNTYKKQVAAYHAFSYAHPDEAAKDCAQLFPVKDSVGKTRVDSTHKAGNVNYQGKIDSLQGTLDGVLGKIRADAANKDNPCASVAANYERQVSALSKQIKSLQDAYKPCKPDIVYRTTPIYQRDMAMERVLRDKVTYMRNSLNLVDSQLKDSKKTAANRLWAIIGLAVALGVGVVAKIRGWI